MKTPLASIQGDEIIGKYEWRNCPPIKNLKRSIQQLKDADDDSLFEHLDAQSLHSIDYKLLAANELMSRDLEVDLESIEVKNLEHIADLLNQVRVLEKAE